MKKFLFVVLVVCAVLFIFAYNKTKPKNLSDLFDEKNEIHNVNNTKNNQLVNNTEDSQSTKEASSSGDENADVEDNLKNTENSEGTDGTESTEPFALDEDEVQAIVSRYIEAEDFYYTILYQKYDLDSYDVITAENSDGYDTQYHRVLYYDINSVDELKNYYNLYFTSDFVAGIDTSSYIEDSGKLYCTQNESSDPKEGAKYIYSVENVDEGVCYVVRKLSNGTASQKIKAVKHDGIWYFTSVAIA